MVIVSVRQLRSVVVGTIQGIIVIIAGSTICAAGTIVMGVQRYFVDENYVYNEEMEQGGQLIEKD